MVVGPAWMRTSEELGVVHVAHLQHISPTSTHLQLHPAAVRLHASIVLLPRRRRRILPYLCIGAAQQVRFNRQQNHWATSSVCQSQIQEPPGGEHRIFRDEGDGLIGNGRKGPMSFWA